MCYMIAVGKKASADGSVMVARTSDWISTKAERIVSVPRKKHSPGEMIRIPESKNVILPQVNETYAFTAITLMVDGDDLGEVAGGVNEFQLSAGASTGAIINEKVEKLCPEPETVTGDYRIQLILERCKTAREAIEWLGEHASVYGVRTDNYILADPNEAWLYEEYQGYHWAAVRVPDDCFVIEANSYRIGYIDPDDHDHYRCDPDLIPFAIKNGLWDPESGEPFHAARAYGSTSRNRGRGKNGEYPQPYYNLHRIWRGISLLAPELCVNEYEATKEYPFFIHPEQAITVEKLLSVLKDTYAETDLDENLKSQFSQDMIVDPTTGHYCYAPAWSRNRVIGCPQAIATWVTQSRNWLPDGIGGVIWAGLAASAAGPHIPFYASCMYTPDDFQRGNSDEKSEYMDNSAYWQFETIGNIMNLFYYGTRDLVIPVWEEFDRKNINNQETIEARALELFQQSREKSAEYLTIYSNQIAIKSLEMAHVMLRKLFTRIALLNNPQTNRVYQLPVEWDQSSLNGY